MQIMCVVILAILFSFKSFSDDGSRKLTNELEAEYSLKKEKNEIKYQEFLKVHRAKTLIIEGELEKAKYYLSKLGDKDKGLLMIKLRYMAIINFLEENFLEGFKNINHPLLADSDVYQNTCQLKILYILKNEYRKNLENEAKRCRNLTIRYSKNELFWLESVLGLVLNNDNKSNLERILGENVIYQDKELLVLYLKKAIFFNQEAKVENNLENLPPKSLESNRVRELLGIIYYRLGKFKKAFSYVEDIYTPNAENIKGNILIKENKNELAFDHFSEAMARKENSLNALLKAVPLAIKLEKWDEAIALSNRLIDSKINSYNRLVLNTYLKIKKNSFNSAAKQLSILNDYFKTETPANLLLLNSYNSLRTLNNKNLKKYSFNSCVKYDGINCWINLSLNSYNDFSALMISDQPIETPSDSIIEELKKEQAFNPLDESPSIDQRDIEELDSKDVLKKAMGNNI